MNRNELLNLKEGLHVELKSAQKGIPANIYETFSAFANTDGGTVYLGIEEGDDNVLLGLNLKTCEKYKTDLLNAIHNNTKFSYPIFSDTDISFIPLENDKYILSVYVKEVSYTHKPVYINNNFSLAYGRDNDGDYLLRIEQVKAMIDDNGATSLDAKLNSHSYDFSIVNLDTLHRFKELLKENNPNNIFNNEDDENLLRRMAMLIKNESGKEVLTNAGLILFTDSMHIQSVFPYYHLDFQTKNALGDKWLNRISSDDGSFSGNLIDFYLKVYSELASNLPSAYVSDGPSNIGPRLMQEALKEALVNAFSNHSFQLNGSLSISRFPSGLELQNNGKMLVPLKRALLGGISLPRNVMIMSIFRLLAIADKAGTGIPKMNECLKRNHFPNLIIREENYPLEKTLVTMTFVNTFKDKGNDSASKVVDLLNQYKEGLSISDILELTNWSRSKTSKLLNEMLAKGLISTNGKEKKSRRFLLP